MSMSERLRFSPSAAMFLAAASASAACWTTAFTDCCSLAGVVLNTTRKCGLFQDQDCPDKIVSNVANLSHAVSAGTGQTTRTEAGSFVCKYTVGTCSGSFGNNLCKYNEEQTITCTTSGATGDACSNTPQ